MNQHAYLKYVMVVFVFVQISWQSSEKKIDTIVLKLNRSEIDLWNIKSNIAENSLCMLPQEIKKQPEGFSKQITMPESCHEKDKRVKIVQNCLMNNLAYNVNVYLGNDKLKRASKPYALTVDLASPWIWIKSPICEKCDRDGQNCDQGCETNTFEQKYDCDKKNGCTSINRCGEIDLYQEGLSVTGQFANTQLRFKDLGYKDSGVKGQKLLWGHALSGQDLLQSDGVFGLGVEYDEEQDEDVGENDYEEETGLLSKLKDEEKYNIDSSVFSLYIADSTFHSDKVVMLGGFSDKYIHEPQNNAIRYAKLYMQSFFNDKIGYFIFLQFYNIYGYFSVRSFLGTPNNLQKLLELHGLLSCFKKYLHKNDDDRDLTNYFLWKVPVNAVLLQMSKEGNLETIQLDSKYAVVSLRTTALVLPQKALNTVTDMFGKALGVSKCNVLSKNQNFMVCSGLDSKEVFNGIFFTIQISDGSDIPIYVNPAQLIQSCSVSKVNKKKKDCILNLQKSYDGVTVLGESVIQNSYVVFNMEDRQIGFAPARTKYNEGLVYLVKEEAVAIAKEVEVDIEFMVRFTAVIVLLTIALCCFRNIECVSRIIERLIGPRKVRIQPQYAEHQGQGINEGLSGNQEGQQELDDSVVSAQNIEAGIDLESDENMKQKIFEMNEQDTLEEL